jgi:hypothetical protein
MKKYALVSRNNNLIENIVICESKELAEEMFGSWNVVEVPELDDITGIDPKVYLPRIGLKYTIEEGFEQPVVITEEVITEEPPTDL